MQSHDGFIFANLRIELQMAARVVGAIDDAFDMYVVTGDISTTSTPSERFTFAQQFLLSTVRVSPKFLAGLNLDPDRLVCLPGNHDKMQEATLERYLSAFGELPAAPPFCLKRQIRGRTFLFFGIDSNLYKEGNIAVGEISASTLGWLNEELTAYSDLDAVRILLLHHHPADLNRFRRASLFSALLGRFTVLEEGKRLLQSCRGRIDVIMHGHEHLPVAFRDPISEAVIVSAGSTMEWQPRSNKNSFHVLVFHDRELQIKQFNWSGARFISEKNYSFKLNLQSSYNEDKHGKIPWF